MTARVVYEGVAGGGGDLFSGMKFYLTMRIPARATLKQYIESNGGTIVKLDTQADYVIADHVRKDAPVGSISWKWIEDSVKNGRLEDFEQYPAGSQTQQFQSVGSRSGQPIRKGRTPFTTEDDRILMEYCTRAERRGASMKGNQLYEEIAQQYPRHTPQSWRDRWIKTLSLRKRPELIEDEEEEKTEEREEAQGEEQEVEVEVEVKEEEEGEGEGQSTAPAPPRKPQEAEEREEAQGEEQEVEEEEGGEEGGEEEGQSTAPAPPRKPQEAEEREEAQGEEQEGGEEEEGEEEEGQSPAPAPPRKPQEGLEPRSSVHTTSLPTSVSTAAFAKVRKTDSPTQPARKSTASSINSESSHILTISMSFDAKTNLMISDGGNVFTDEENALLFDAYDEITNLDEDKVIDAWLAWFAKYPNHTPQEWRNHFKEYIVPKREVTIAKKVRKKDNGTLRLGANRPEVSPPAKSTNVESGNQTTLSTASTKANPYLLHPEEFKRNLSEFARNFGIVPLEPNICGREVSLFEIWQTVTSDDFGGYGALKGADDGADQWWKVAEKLGFDLSSSSDTGADMDLRRCYDENLADFEDYRRYLFEDDEPGSEDEALITKQLRETTQQSVGSDREDQHPENGQLESFDLSKSEKEPDSEIQREDEEGDENLESGQRSPRSPGLPSPSARRRRFRTEPQYHDSQQNKRQRIDKGKEREIPSTPENIIKGVQTIRTSHQVSPLKFADPLPDSASSDDFAFDEIEERQPIKLGRRERNKAPFFEPETQDFQFSQVPRNNPWPAPEDMEGEEDEADFSLVTPPRNRHPPPAEDNDEDDGIVLVKDSPPPVPTEFSEQRNIGTSTTIIARGSHHACGNNYDWSTQSQDDSLTKDKLATFIDQHVMDGYAEEIVIRALDATCLSLTEAPAVIESLANGDGIPEDIAGVWTERDDEALNKSKSSIGWRRIVMKHGVDGIRKRKKHLELLQAAGG